VWLVLLCFSDRCLLYGCICFVFGICVVLGLVNSVGYYFYIYGDAFNYLFVFWCLLVFIVVCLFWCLGSLLVLRVCYVVF